MCHSHRHSEVIGFQPCLLQLQQLSVSFQSINSTNPNIDKGNAPYRIS